MAWVCYGATYKHDIDFEEDVVNAIPVGTELYTSPPQRQPLTYEQIDSMWQNTDTGDSELDAREFARAIEAKLKEKK